MTRVKICGHTTVEDVEASVRAGADAVGVIVDVPVETPREVSVDRAATLLDAVPPFVTGVIVTMPETPERAVELVDRLDPDALQVHGDLPRGDLAYLRSTLDVRLLATADADDPGRIDEYADLADAVLVDSVDEAGAGGTGRTHDWDRTQAAATAADATVVLAGGLTPDNVGDAVETVEPYGVDVASGVEATGGRKDHEAVASFVDRAKGYRQEATR